MQILKEYRQKLCQISQFTIKKQPENVRILVYRTGEGGVGELL